MEWMITEFKNEFLDIALFENYLNEDINITYNTVYLYKTMANAFLLRNPNLNDINSYNEFIKEFCFKKRSISAYYALIKFIDYKITDKNLKVELKNNLIKPKFPSSLKRERIKLTDEQILSVISAITHFKHRVIALIQMFTGIRAGDVLRIMENNIKPEIIDNNPVLSLRIIGKGERRHVVVIYDKNIQEVIYNYINGIRFNPVPGYYFLEYSKTKIIKNNFSVVYRYNYDKYFIDFKKALNKNNINLKDFATHDIRRAFALKIWAKYKDLILLQKMLNHQSANTTAIYLKQHGLETQDIFKELQKEIVK